jgi:hypothetical protein
MKKAPNSAVAAVFGAFFYQFRGSVKSLLETWSTMHAKPAKPENNQIPQSKLTLCGIRRSKLLERQQIVIPKGNSA